MSSSRFLAGLGADTAACDRGYAGAAPFRQGAYGDAVRDLQTDLNALGFNAGSVDGQFGAATAAALKAFQTAAGITADAIVGPVTQGKLCDAVAGRPWRATTGPGPDPDPPGLPGEPLPSSLWVWGGVGAAAVALIMLARKRR